MQNLTVISKMTSMEIAEVTAVIKCDDKRKGLVYVIESDGMVKIGKTKNLHQRITTILNTSGRTANRIAITPFCNNYSEVETKIHKLFKNFNQKSEWFKVPFDSVVAKLEKFHFDTSTKLSKENPYLKLFEMAMKM